MKRTLLIVLFFCTLAAFAQMSSAREVSVYSQFDPNRFGWDGERLDYMKVSLDQLSNARPVGDITGRGFLTALVLDRRVVEAMQTLLRGYKERWLSDAWMWIELVDNREIYHYFNQKLNIECSYTVEKPSAEILDLIKSVYANDPVSRAEVLKHYQDNYVLRILTAENVHNILQAKLDFSEALVMATYLGDRSQWLWGIHDGLGSLSNLPSLLENLGRGLNDYRPLGNRGAALHSFLAEVMRIPGDPVRNLAEKTFAWFELTAASAPQGELPEEFVVSRKGSGREFAVFYYDVLRRMGYECVLAAMVPSRDAPAVRYITFFRSSPREPWGALYDKMLADFRSESWRRLPALVLKASCFYAELDPQQFFRQRRIDLPDRAKPEWQASLLPD